MLFLPFTPEKLHCPLSEPKERGWKRTVRVYRDKGRRKRGERDKDAVEKREARTNGNGEERTMKKEGITLEKGRKKGKDGRRKGRNRNFTPCPPLYHFRSFVSLCNGIFCWPSRHSLFLFSLALNHRTNQPISSRAG